MRRVTLQREATSAVLPRLDAGENVVGAAAVWVTTPRSALQRVLSARRLLPAAVTEQRLVLFRPPAGDKVDPTAVALEIPLAHLRVAGVGRLPLLQVRLRAGRNRVIVVEFRPRDRWLGRELVERIEGVPQPSPPPPRPPTPPPPASGSAPPTRAPSPRQGPTRRPRPDR